MMISLDLDVIPCRDALDSVPDHGGHDRNGVAVCPGTFLHEYDLPDRAAAYDAIGRIADLAAVDWPTMANSVAAVTAAGRPDAAAVDAAVALLDGRDQ